MTRNRTIAYTSDDLIGIAKVVKRIVQRLEAFDAYSDSDIKHNIQDLRVDVLYDDEYVGYVGLEAGWLGFFPHNPKENA